MRDIESLVDGLGVYRYRFDTDRMSVERILGGDPGEPYHISGSYWAADIKLPHNLSHGQSHTLEFMSRFHTPEFEETCFRRAAHERFENITLRVEFHQSKLPAKVWWAVWKDYRKPNIIIEHKDLFQLDSDNAVEHHLDVLERAVVGFCWEW